MIKRDAAWAIGMTKQEVALRLAQAHEELDEAQARIAALTAELAQLKAQTWQPVQGLDYFNGQDNAYPVSSIAHKTIWVDCGYSDIDPHAAHEVELPDGYAICKRQEVTGGA